jgi:SAM-dependent methyltransferase
VTQGSWTRRPPIRVDLSITHEQLDAMVARVERSFRHLGETEPHWSVLAAEKYKTANIMTIPWVEAEFWDSGRIDVEDLVETVTRCGLNFAEYESCFELGCGVGRVTIWLAQRFRKVVAADISRSHLKIAEGTLKRFQRGNVSFSPMSSPSILDVDNFDVFFSILTLQHNPPPVIRLLLITALQKLRPGGVAYFQLPTYRLGYSFDVEKYLTQEVNIGGPPEMHVLPQPELLEAIEITG